MHWEQAALLVGLLSPLVGVPLLVITFYLRAIREHQTTTAAEINHRIRTIESAIHDLLKATSDFERTYATKEEWVRESMVARQRLERITEMMARFQAEMENGHGVAAELGRTAHATCQVAQRLALWCEQNIGRPGQRAGGTTEESPTGG